MKKSFESVGLVKFSPIQNVAPMHILNRNNALNTANTLQMHGSQSKGVQFISSRVISKIEHKDALKVKQVK